MSLFIGLLGYKLGYTNQNKIFRHFQNVSRISLFRPLFLGFHWFASIGSDHFHFVLRVS